MGTFAANTDLRHLTRVRRLVRSIRLWPLQRIGHTTPVRVMHHWSRRRCHCKNEATDYGGAGISASSPGVSPSEGLLRYRCSGVAATKG